MYRILINFYIKNGDIVFGVQKSSSWMSTTASFKVREPRLRQSKSEQFTSKQQAPISSQDSATGSPDFTPPSSDSLQSQEDCPGKKSLFTSPKSCAIKSLKRLSSECKTCRF